MSEDLHDITEPVISANDGWRQMQALLNEHLPVEVSILRRRQSLRYAFAAALLLVLLFPTLQLDNKFSTITANKKTFQPITAFRTANSFLTLNKTTRVVTINKLPRNITLLKNTSVHFSYQDKQVLAVQQDKINQPAAAANSPGNRAEKIINGMIEKQTVNRLSAATVVTKATSASAYPKSNKKAIAKASWSLSGGIAMNTAFSNSQDLQPYPIAEARYNITPVFYLAAGLSAWSPVSTSTGGLSKTIYLNDTINNISLYNETTTYSRLRYADIPLTMGVNITKNISIQSGIQVSVLLNKRTTKVLAPYDFQMNSITPPISLSNPLSTATAANMQKDYEVKVHHIDYRFVAGLRYTQKKTTVGLMYQQGLRYVGRGANTNKNSNQVLTLNVLFQIK
ncbi:MAG: hypothetical protein ABIQ31_19035 [Ferruginibacter sp.]